MENLGFHFLDWHAWTWAWGVPELDRNVVMTVKKVLSYSLDLDLKHNDVVSLELILLKNQLITSRSFITSKIQVDINCALASYLSKKQFILPVYYGKNRRGEYEFIPYYDYDILGDITPNYNNVVMYMFVSDPPDLD